MMGAQGRIPPQDLDAELAVLGGMLLDNDAVNKVIEILEARDFYRESHQEIFQAVLTLYQKNEPIDLITVANVLKATSRLDMVGGASYLASLADGMPTTANIAYHAKIVHQQAILRRLIAAANTIADMSFVQGEDSVDNLVDQAEQIIYDIAEQKSQQSFASMRDIVKASFKEIEEMYENKKPVSGLSTGFSDLDAMTSGMHPSDLVIIAGRPSMGKTAFALSVLAHSAIHEDEPVALFSLEMSKEQLVKRLLCSEAKVDASKLRGGYLAESDWPKLTRAAGLLSEAPIYIDDTPAISILEMRAKSRRLQREKGLKMVAVDYLQLMRGVGKIESREREISEISRGLKALAKELNVPVIALSQLNRGVESRQDKRPMMSDLRESGAIEQDADVIAFVYRDEMYNKESPDKGIAEIVIGKQRNGPTGTVRLAFLGDYTRFENLAPGAQMIAS